MAKGARRSRGLLQEWTMTFSRFSVAALCVFSFAACGDNDDGDPLPEPTNFPTTSCADVGTTPCVEIQGGDEAALQTAANSLAAGTTLVLGEGTFAMTNGLTIRTAGAHIIGQGIAKTTLDFAAVAAQVNGVDAISDDFLVQDLTVKDAPKDGIRGERRRRLSPDPCDVDRRVGGDERRIRHLPREIEERARRGQPGGERVRRRPLCRPV
jgi:hypothetical protein